jgi:hypothetical protein
MRKMGEFLNSSLPRAVASEVSLGAPGDVANGYPLSTRRYGASSILSRTLLRLSSQHGVPAMGDGLQKDEQEQCEEKHVRTLHSSELL